MIIVNVVKSCREWILAIVIALKNILSSDSTTRNSPKKNSEMYTKLYLQ